jgi:hypothetical protein
VDAQTILRAPENAPQPGRVKSEAELAFHGCQLQPRRYNLRMAVEVDDCLREHREELRMKEAVFELVTSWHPDPVQRMWGNSPRY